MRKILKAAAMLTVGGVLLSTSAFAELGGTAVYNAETGKIDVNVTGLGTGESTIMVLKSETAINAIPSTVADADIVYIDQKTAVEGKASYSIDPGTRGADVNTYYVFAGGTNETSATFIDSVTGTIAATGVVIKEGGADAVAAKDVAIGDVLTFAAVVSPENATDTVNWTVSPNAEGILTVATDGTATFTAPSVGTDTVYTVTATAGTASDSIALTVKAPAAPGRDFITAADTGKGTIKVDKASVTSDSMGAAVGNNIVSLELNTTEYANAGNDTAGYAIAVVDAEGNAVENASVFYSKERKKYVALIPTSVTGYKFEVLGADATANDVIAKYGNINEDAAGLINALDYMQFCKVYKKTADAVVKTSAKKALIADVNGDGQINALDYMQFCKAYKKQTYTFAVTTK